MRMVTSVGIAMPRMLPLMTPSISTTTNTQSRPLPASRNASAGAVRSIPSATAYNRDEAAVDSMIMVFLR